MGPVPINDTQILPQPPYALKVAKLGFWSKKMQNDLESMKNQSRGAATGVGVTG